MCVFDYKVKVNKCPGGKKNFGGNKKTFFEEKFLPMIRGGGALAAATAWFGFFFPRPQKKRSISEPPFNHTLKNYCISFCIFSAMSLKIADMLSLVPRGMNLFDL